MRTDTRGAKMEAGDHTFEIAGVPETINQSGFEKIQFLFKVAGTDQKPFKMSFFDNQLGGLLKALGMTEIEEGVFDWEPELVVGSRFIAELFYEADKSGKINEKTGQVQMYYKLRNFKQSAQIAPEDIAWKE